MRSLVKKPMRTISGYLYDYDLEKLMISFAYKLNTCFKIRSHAINE